MNSRSKQRTKKILPLQKCNRVRLTNKPNQHRASTIRMQINRGENEIADPSIPTSRLAVCSAQNHSRVEKNFESTERTCTTQPNGSNVHTAAKYSKDCETLKLTWNHITRKRCLATRMIANSNAIFAIKISYRKAYWADIYTVIIVGNLWFVYNVTTLRLMWNPWTRIECSSIRERHNSKSRSYATFVANDSRRSHSWIDTRPYTQALSLSSVSTAANDLRPEPICVNMVWRIRSHASIVRSANVNFAVQAIWRNTWKYTCKAKFIRLRGRILYSIIMKK